MSVSVKRQPETACLVRQPWPQLSQRIRYLNLLTGESEGNRRVVP